MEGRAIPSPYIHDEWELQRVIYSIERYNLDFPPLMSKRKLVWQNCWQHIEVYLNELGNYQKDSSNAIAKAAFKQEAMNIRKLLTADQECSAVARACLLSAGDKRVQGLLQST
jgi:hypothetical protein